MINRKSIVNSPDDRLRQFNRMPIPTMNTRMYKLHKHYILLTPRAATTEWIIHRLNSTINFSSGFAILCQALHYSFRQIYKHECTNSHEEKYKCKRIWININLTSLANLAELINSQNPKVAWEKHALQLGIGERSQIYVGM